MEWDIYIMSVDPDIIDSEDPHQKYGYRVTADSKEDAKKLGILKLRENHGDLPIYWVEAYRYDK